MQPDLELIGRAKRLIVHNAVLAEFLNNYLRRLNAAAESPSAYNLAEADNARGHLLRRVEAVEQALAAGKLHPPGLNPYRGRGKWTKRKKRRG